MSQGAFWHEDPRVREMVVGTQVAYADILVFIQKEHGVSVPLASFRRWMSTHGISRNGPCGAKKLPPGAQPKVARDPEKIVAPETTAEKIIEETRQERERQKTKNELRIMREHAAAQVGLMDAIRAELRAHPVIRVQGPDPDRETRGRPATLLLHISDTHMGMIFESVANGSYNIDLAAERFRRMAEKILAIAEAVRAHRTVDQLTVAWGGDIVDGRDIHPGHDWQSAPIEVQLNRGTAIVRDALMAPLARTFAHIQNICIPGNHGRLGKKGQLHRVKDNMDVIFYGWLQDRCGGMANVVWQQTRDYYVHFKLHGHTFVLAHGDAFKAWAGIPFYGATRYLQQLSSLLYLPIDALLVGHHHQAASWMHGHSEISMNGCMVTGGEFANFLGYGGPAVQKLFLVEDRFPLATPYNLRLSTREEVLTAKPLDLDEAFNRMHREKEYANQNDMWDNMPNDIDPYLNN